jgi:hypothetical protein
MKKRAVRFEINFTNRWLYSFIVFGIVLIAAFGVFAYNSGKSPSVMGHTADEIDGLNQVVENIVNSKLSNLGGDQSVSYTNQGYCGEESLVYDSTNESASDWGVKDKPGWMAVDLKENCFSVSGCRIVQKLYDAKNGLRHIRVYDFFQGSNGVWWSTYRDESGSSMNGGKIGGDPVSVNIFPSADDKLILIRDDHSECEVDSSKISIRDGSAKFAQKVYIC